MTKETANTLEQLLHTMVALISRRLTPNEAEELHKAEREFLYAIAHEPVD